MDSYKGKHKELNQDAVRLLDAAGKSDKEPKAAASVFSWITTEMKMMLKGDAHQAAKLMMDGCNMGIQSISEHQNQYTAAEDEAKNLAEKLVKIEEDFMEEMKPFL